LSRERDRQHYEGQPPQMQGCLTLFEGYLDALRGVRVGDSFGVASRLDDNVAKRSPDGTNGRGEYRAREWRTQRSAAEKVAVNRRDFFAEQQTWTPEASGTRRQWDSCRASLPG
jgi:hypothetical protein